MRRRTLARGCALTGLGAALTLAAPASSHAVDLPVCSPGGYVPSVPRSDAPACRAASRILESSVARDSGYTHLGATTADRWAGVSGRLTVRDAAVRPGTYDFLASRFMVKREMGGGRVAWLEAGWAETGWAGDGRQRIYTYDTATRNWHFYDAYGLSDGDQIWLNLHTDADGTWQAWLWWDERWNLLDAQKLPLGDTAQVEQYVEVHVDTDHPARIAVPPVEVDNVQLMPPDGGVPLFWRQDVETYAGETAAQPRDGGFCVDWISRYDTWSAGDCAQVP